MPWNVANHRRKFLTAPGRYVDAADQLSAAELVFWGEWEAPSRVEQRWPTAGRLPRALHRPYWTTPGPAEPRQNTDPWVWGEHMIYSNCKQTVGPNRHATSMRRLTPGSVICFGSTIHNEFCLDTVFVVASAEPWVPANAHQLDLSDAFIACTADALAVGAADGHLELTLYRGATVDAPIDGTYSFAPASMADYASGRFARPAIRVPELINPDSRQSTWGSKRQLDPSRVRAKWQDVVDQVLDSGLVLGVHFQVPRHQDTHHPLPAGARSRC